MDVQTVVDSNPLLTTIAAVSGGTAAIVGGFVLSTIIGLAAERSQLARIVEDLKNGIEELRVKIELRESGQQSQIEAGIFNFLVEEFADQSARLDEERCRSLVLSHAEVEITNVDSAIEKYLEKRAAAEACINDFFARLEPGARIPSFREFRGRHPAHTQHPALLEQFFDHAKERRQSEAGFRSTTFNRTSESTAYTPVASRRDLLNSVSLSAVTEIKELRRREAQDENALRMKRAELNASKLPKFVSFGVLVFTYQIVACVILPLTYVGLAPGSVGGSEIRLLRILFDLQFGLLFTYLILLIRPFLRHSSQAGEPT